MMRPIRSLLVLLALAACDSPTVTPVTGDPAVQRQVWEDQGIDDYRYLFNVYGSMSSTPRMRVDVRDGEVVAVVDAGTGERLNREMWEGLVLTVDGVFDKLAAARAQGTYTEMAFHPRLGYPMVAQVDRLEFDAGIVYSIQGLRRLD
jgi:hypothetical protein